MNIHEFPCMGPVALAVILACVLWFGAACAALRACFAVRDLRDEPYLPPRETPTVSLLVPARNEALTLPAAAATWRALSDDALQIVLVDDRSDDGTSALVDEIAARDPRVVPVHVTELPPGWLGKNHALQRAVDASTGEWLLFTDADIHFAPDAIRRAIAFASVHRLDHLALLPDLTNRGFLLDCALAQFARSFLLGQRVWDVSNPRSTASVGVGAFNLVRRSALARTAGLSWLALDPTDDVALGKLLKRSGARCAVAGGRGLLSVTWYATLGEMARGLEKNTFPVLGCSLPRAAILVGLGLFFDLAPLLALLPWGVPWMGPLGGAAILAVLAVNVGIAVRANRPLLPAVLWPIGSLLMAAIVLRAAIVGHRRGGIRWRDTFHSCEELRRGARVTFP